MNTAPTLTGSPAWNDISPQTDDIINCSYGTLSPSDADNDALTFYYDYWDTPTRIFILEDNSTLDLGYSGLDDGDDLGCKVKVKDTSNANSSWSSFTATNATIQNSAPTTPILVSPANGSSVSSLTVELKITGSDADNDALFFWYSVNNTIYGSSQNYTYTAASEDYYNWTALASDNSTNSSWASTYYFTVSLDNVPPNFYFNNTNIVSPNTNEEIGFNINWTDNVGLSFNFFETNITGTTVNFTTKLSGISQNVNITNITSSNEGRFYWKSYSNDTKNNWNLTNRLFVTVTAPAAEAAPRAVDGRRIVEAVPFSIDKDLLTLKIKQGEIQREVIVIKNTGNIDRQFNLRVEEIERFVILSEESFILSRGESKKINVDFFVSENEPAGVYAGRIIVDTGLGSKSINVIFEIIEKVALFDTRSELFDTTLSKNQKLKAEIYMLEIGDLDKKIDVTLEYFIKDFNGNQIKIGEETVGVYKDLVIVRKFPLPRGLEFEDYLFYVKLSYLDSIATSANRFTIVKEPAFISYIKNNFIILLIFILIPITLFLVIKLKKKSETTKTKIKHPLRGLPNKLHVDFLRTIYKFKLLKAEYEAGFFDKQITAIKNLIKKISKSIQNFLRIIKDLVKDLSNKIYVDSLRIMYKFKLLKAEYEAGLFDKQIKPIKN